ncbi:MAG: metallophosphoesterase family protein [Bacillota bacterium]|nr:metallophosphoesterase family protein [Bacillota bacterium]
MLKFNLLRNVRCWRTAAVLATAVAGALLCMYLLGPAAYEIHGLSLRAGLVPATAGKTVIELPPFGSLSAATHPAPLELHVRLDGVGADIVGRALAPDSDQREILDDVQAAAERPLLFFALRQVAAGALGAFLAVLLLWRPRLRVALAAGLTGAVLIAGLVFAGAAGFRADAFREPEYDGVLAAAPDVLRLANETLDRFKEVQDRTLMLVENIQALFSRVDNLALLGAPDHDGATQPVLLVSDLHSNPVGLEFMEALVENFGVKAILDAGDLSDFGSPLETQTATRLERLGVPYVFAPGNHDTPDVMRFIDGLGNGVRLRGKTVEVAGVRIIGSADPLAYDANAAVVDQETLEDGLDRQADALRAAIQMEGQPDIILVHDPLVAHRLADMAPLAVSGHTHRQALEETGGLSVLLNPGTTGAAGVRGLSSEEGVPYSAIILHIHPGKGAVAADFIEYQPLSGRFSVERRLLDHGLRRVAGFAQFPVSPPVVAP